MKKNLPLIVLVLVFVLVLGGAYLLYSRLGAQFSPQTLAAEPGVSSDSSASSGTSEPSGETATLEDSSDEDSSDEEPSGEDTSDSEPQRTAAPDFTVTDLDGNEVHLSDFIGKPVVLNFWASWCGPCKSEMPDFDQFYAKYGEDIHFVMVNATDGSRETVDTASAFLAEQGYSFPVYYDTEHDASITYGVTALPTTYFIDAEGYLVAYAFSALDSETLQTGIDMIYPAA